MEKLNKIITSKGFMFGPLSSLIVALSFLLFNNQLNQISAMWFDLVLLAAIGGIIGYYIISWAGLTNVTAFLVPALVLMVNNMIDNYLNGVSPVVSSILINAVVAGIIGFIVAKLMWVKK